MNKVFEKEPKIVKIHVWIGNFQSEMGFTDYVNQSEYLKAWQMYNDGDEDYEDDDEPDENLRCRFCKEINLDFYDEDFIVLQFNEKSQDIKQLVSITPVDADKLMKACKQKNLGKGNALIYYSNDELAKSDASKCKSMTYLGTFEQVSPTVIGGEGFQGLRNHLWAGITQKTKEKFMEYFDQDGKECQFCKDVGIKTYNPNSLYVYYGKMDSAEKVINNTIPDENLYESMLDKLEEQNFRKINALFCYVDNGCRNPKKDELFYIFLKKMADKYPKPKNFLDEKDSYNDLKYIGNFSWD